MKQLMIFAACGLAATLFAQAVAPAASPKEIAQQSAVNEMLLDDDGVCIVTAPDGSFQIFTRGTGVYQFVNPKAELAARRVARLNAEKNLVKFISTNVESSDSLDQLQKNSLTISGDGKIQEQHPSLEDVETVAGQVKSGAKGIINGLVVVESKKVPTEGGTGGMIQVTMVYSSKTAKASGWVGKKMQNHQAELKINEAKNEARVNSARREAENARQTDTGAAAASERAAVGGDVATPAAPGTGGATTPVNRPERRVNKTEF